MRRRSTRRSAARGAVVVVAALTAIGLAGPAGADSPAPKSSASTANTYTVVKGDTLSGVAARTGVSASAIASANSLKPPYPLSVGMRLRIPRASRSTAQSTAKKPAQAGASIPRGPYKVVAGDTIERISRRSGVSVTTLAAVNGLRPPQYPIFEGQTLTISTKAPASATKAKAKSKGDSVKPGRYVVRRGDTVIGLARRAGVAPRAIIAANGLTPPSYMIRDGSALTIPSSSAGAPRSGAAKSGGPGRSAAQETRGGPVAGSGYRVRRGDTVIGLASRSGVSAAAIIAANGLRPPSYMIRDGQALQIPKKGAVPTTSTRTKAPAVSAGAPPGDGRHPNKAQVGAALEANARRYGLPADLVKGLAWQESGWRQEVVSSVGAVGVMQLMPGTAQWIGDNLTRRRIDSNNYNDNVQGGTAYLDYLLGQVNQDERLALASYYQGLSTVKKRGLLKESERYVASVQANRKKFK